MQCKLRLLSALLCLGAIEQTNAFVGELDPSLEMPFDSLVDFYLNPNWLKLQLNEASFSRYGLLRDVDRNVVIDGLSSFIVLNQLGLTSGGAVAGDNVTLSNNKNVSICYGNRALQGGGSVYATNTILITNNVYPWLFINNFPLGTGPDVISSCFSADTVRIEDNPGLVVFKNNHVRYYKIGGAITINSGCFIKNSGPVIFENNQGYWGGAICTGRTINRAPSKVHLFAEQGDIVFNKNISIDRIRNSIHCLPDYSIQLGAKKGYAVRLYDPIEARHETSYPVIFNPNPDHLGTVLFSGITIPRDTLFTKDSLKSLIQYDVQISHGFLAIDDGAHLRISSLQAGDGVLRLGNSAVVSTADKQAVAGTTTNNITFNIPHLALNLPALLQKEALPPKFWISPRATTTNNVTVFSEDTRNTTSITISGELTFLDEANNQPYDSVDLSQPRKKLPLLYLCDTTTPKIDVSNLKLGALNQQEPHYGYQGVWDSFWEHYTSISDPSSAETTNTQHRILYAHWKPSGYIPNPRNVSYFAANSLWVSSYGILPFLQTTVSKSSIFQAQGKATRTVHTQKNKNNIPGFHINTRGYWVSLATSASETNHQLSMQFGQDFTQTKENDSFNRIASKGYTAALQFLSSWYHDWIETTLKTAYAYGEHRVHNLYTQEDPAYSVGDFRTQTLGASLTANMPIRFPQLSSLIDPFLDLKGVHASLSTFKEKGPYKKVLRSFVMEKPLIETTTALGVAFHPLTLPRYVHWFTSVAYQPTIYRQRPKLNTVLLTSNGSWTVLGTSPDKHTIVTHFNFAFSPIPTFHLEAEYKGNFAKSTINHFITAGCSLYF